jgi:hypothetical protein
MEPFSNMAVASISSSTFDAGASRKCDDHALGSSSRPAFPAPTSRALRDRVGQSETPETLQRFANFSATQVAAEKFITDLSPAQAVWIFA